MASNEGCHMVNCLRKVSHRQDCCHIPLLLLKDRETYRRQQNHGVECERDLTAARRLECHLILKYAQLWKYLLKLELCVYYGHLADNNGTQDTKGMESLTYCKAVQSQIYGHMWPAMSHNMGQKNLVIKPINTLYWEIIPKRLQCA
jgi:hypothetical protein